MSQNENAERHETSAAPRHNLPVKELAVDPDPLFHPSQGLVAALSANQCSIVDRPLVPLLNALIARGIRTGACCADASLCVVGMGKRQGAALAAVQGSAPWIEMQWAVNGLFLPNGSTSLWWYDKFGPADSDLHFLKSAQTVSEMHLTNSPALSLQGRWLRDLLLLFKRADSEGRGPGLIKSAPVWHPSWPASNRELLVRQSGDRWTFEIEDRCYLCGPLLCVEASSFCDLQLRVEPKLEEVLSAPPESFTQQPVCQRCISALSPPPNQR